MGRLLKKTVILLLLLTVVFAFANYWSSAYNIKKTVPIISQKNNILIIGNSRTECALDDKIISSAVNLSRSGESYFYLRPKLTSVLDKNPHIRYVVIQFSPSEINDVYQSIWEDKYVYEFLPRYVSRLKTEELYLLVKKNPKVFFHCMSGLSILKNIELCGFGKIKCNSAWGSFWRLDRNIDTTKQKKELDVVSTYNSHNLQSLLEIVLMLKEKKVTPVFIGCPVLLDNFDVAEFEKIRLKYFPDVLYLNFSEAGLPLRCFGDYGHLNRHGAKLFSVFIDSLFKRDVLLNPKGFVDSVNSISCQNFDCSLL